MSDGWQTFSRYQVDVEVSGLSERDWEKREDDFDSLDIDLSQFLLRTAAVWMQERCGSAVSDDPGVQFRVRVGSAV